MHERALPRSQGDLGEPDLRRGPGLVAIPRREALRRLSAGSLLALGLWPGVLRAGDAGAGGRFRFIVVNDTHYLSPECGAWLQTVVRLMKSHDEVEFCLHAGDLTEYGRRADFAAMRDILEGLGMPYYVVLGNHDYLSPKTPEPAGAESAAAAVPNAPPAEPLYAPSDPRQGRPLRPKPRTERGTHRRFYQEFFPRRVNYHFRHQGWQFVGLDTTEELNYQNTRIQPPTFRWLDDHLSKLDPKQPTVIFTHFPMGAGVKYRPANADDLLDRFRDFNLQAVFCGHYHALTERQRDQTTFTTNRCCALKRGNHDGSKPKGYFLCTAEHGRVSRRFIEVKMPSKA